MARARVCVCVGGGGVEMGVVALQGGLQRRWGGGVVVVVVCVCVCVCVCVEVGGKR